MKGIVQLIRKDKVVASGSYGCRANRNIILLKWQYLYGKKFNDCIVNVIPAANGQMNYKGRNCTLGEAHFEIDELLERNKEPQNIFGGL